MRCSNARTVFFVGHAKLPQGMPASSVYNTLAISLEVDCRFGVVVNAACTLATEHGKSFISSLLIGHCLADGIDDMAENIRTYYKGAGQNALIAALKDLHKNYEQYMKEDSQ